MSYNTISTMRDSASLMARVTAAAAGEGINRPAEWTQDQMWFLASSPGWADAWESAVASQTADDNPDTGARTSVITDGAILAAVQARKAALDALEPTP